MRVLHLTSSFPRGPGDHVAPFIHDLLRAQIGVGLDVAVLAPHDPGAARDEVMDGARVLRFRYAPDRYERLAYRGGLLGRSRQAGGFLLLPMFLLSFAMAALGATRRLKPDVLHAHWWLPAGLCALPTARMTGVPLVVTLHGSDMHITRHAVVRPFAKFVLARADLVVAVSEDLQRAVVERLGVAPERVQVLRLPTPPVEETAPPLPPAPPVRLLAAGRMAQEKGFDVLLRAMRMAVDRGLDARLVLIGSGPERARMERLAVPLGSRVQIFDAVAREELFRRIGQAHALVMPSRREGLGLMALEAIARGRPVVATRAGGLPEAVTDGVDGILVPPDDVEALADALSRLPLRPPVGVALQRHDPAAVGQGHADAYAALRTPSPPNGSGMDAPSKFDVRGYWESRLSDDFSLRGVGFRTLGRRFNEWMYKVRREVFIREVGNLGLDLASADVLDIGSGTGFYVRLWQELGAGKVSGCDLTSAAVEGLRRSIPTATFEQVDITAETIPLPEGAYDAISCCDVLFHVVDDDAYARALRNIGRLLKPGGYFLYSDNFLHRPTERVPHQASRSLDEVTEALSAAGLIPVRRVPMLVLMNDPVDSDSRARRLGWAAAMRAVSLTEATGWLAGAALYPIERRLVQRRTESPTTELMVTRRAS